VIRLKWLDNWLSRHRHPVSFALHMVGIPATIVAVPFAILGWWWLAVAVFAGGYALQFIGHAIEGNRSGEEILLRRILRRGDDDATGRCDESR